MAIVRFSLQMGDRLPAHTAVVMGRGAIVNGNQTNVNAVAVHSGHDLSVNDKFYYALSRSNVIRTRVFTVTVKTATLITYSGAPFSWPSGAFLVPLGVDTGAELQSDGSWSDPNFDGSPLTAYSDPNGDGSYPYAEVPVEPGGDLGFWCATFEVWILALDSRRRIVRVYIQSAGGSSSGPTVFVVTAATLPAAGASYDFGTTGVEYVVRDSGFPDVTKRCLQLASGSAYDWFVVAQADR